MEPGGLELAAGSVPLGRVAEARRGARGDPGWARPCPAPGGGLLVAPWQFFPSRTGGSDHQAGDGPQPSVVNGSPLRYRPMPAVV
jgi:hypothetical protein